MNYVKDEVIVLNRRDYGERDRILTVLGRQHGKMTLIAKSVRSAKSKLAGGIELFSVSEISYVRGKGDMSTLTGARLLEHFLNINKDIDRSNAAYELLKRTDKITESDHGQEFFVVLSSSLEALNNIDHSANMVKTWFSIKIMEVSGQMPSLKNDSQGERLEEAAGYNYDFDSHCFTIHKDGKYKMEDVKLLRVLAGSQRVPEVQVSEGSLNRTAGLVEQLTQMQLY